MQEIKLDASTMRNELKEKLKNLQKYKVSEEFAKIKEYCESKVDVVHDEIATLLEEREVKAEKHNEIYSDLDFMLLDKKYLEYIMSLAKDKTFIGELKDGIDNIISHVYLKSDVNFDICVHSQLSYVKRQYKLYMGIEHTIDEMITRYELQEKEINLENTTNAYATPQSGSLSI